ncbi:MAG: hypothetical protein IPG33_11465 [Betaproteobacteria bacterium]|nr:hypothetical protein [Betaproteobacteria bacterium]
MLENEHLTDVREVEVDIERRAAPDTARIDATVIGRCHLDEVRTTRHRCAAVASKTTRARHW